MYTCKVISTWKVDLVREWVEERDEEEKVEWLVIPAVDVCVFWVIKQKVNWLGWQLYKGEGEYKNLYAVCHVLALLNSNFACDKV